MRKRTPKIACPNCGDANRRGQRPLNDEDNQFQCHKCGMVYRIDAPAQDARRCPATHSGKGLHQRIVDADAGTYRCLFCNETYRVAPEIKTYDAGQGRRATVPENPISDETLFDAIKDNFSPEAVAAMAAYLQAANTKNRRVNQQLTWFAGELVKMLGATGYDRLLADVGL